MPMTASPRQLEERMLGNGLWPKLRDLDIFDGFLCPSAAAIASTATGVVTGAVSIKMVRTHTCQSHHDPLTTWL